MRVDVHPRTAEVQAGVALPITITIANTGTVIGGYAIRVLGADPSWVNLDTTQISLFPDESRTITAQLTVPDGLPAGTRRIAVQVREVTPPHASTVAEVDLTVPAAETIRMRPDPLTSTGGRKSTFSIVVSNTGNTVVHGRLAGDDPEGKVRFEFDPATVKLAPGEHAVVDLGVKARPPLTGSPVARVMSLYLDPVNADDFFVADPEHEQARDEHASLAMATFVQKAVISRGPLSLLGLLAAVTVFALVITFALSRLVSQSAADRDLALQVAAARDRAAVTGTSGVAGTVVLLTSGQAVRGVSVGVYSTDNPTTALATTATDARGAYRVTGLAAGSYLISFQGAGFVQLWYPGAASSSDATQVNLKSGEQRAGLDVRLGGVPATIQGTVVGDDVATATLTLKTTAATGSTAAEATVRTVPIGSDGTFTLTDVPSPSIYNLVVTKTGYATSTQRIDVGAGETRGGVVIRLQKGDGVIAGHVYSTAGPLGGVTLTATSGQSTSSTVSLTTDDVGSFTLRSLPTPATFTIVASVPGFAAQTLTLTLSAGQSLTGVAITMSQSAGSLSGHVSTLPGRDPATGVSVTVTDGLLAVQTVTESGTGAGNWKVSGLPIPGTYTVTFARSDLASQTVSVSLDSSGAITAGSQQGTTITSAGISIAMQSATATVYGTVTQPPAPGAAAVRLGEATVTLNSGSSTYRVTTASVPTGNMGAYRIDRVPAGTYTLTVAGGGGTSPRSRVITLTSGQTSKQDVALAAPAAMSGTVVSVDGTTPRVGWTVILYLATEYPTKSVAMTVTTGPDGAFSFRNIDAGNYIVEVRPTQGSAPVASKTVTVMASEQVTGVSIQADPDE